MFPYGSLITIPELACNLDTNPLMFCLVVLCLQIKVLIDYYYFFFSFIGTVFVMKIFGNPEINTN